MPPAACVEGLVRGFLLVLLTVERSMHVIHCPSRNTLPMPAFLPATALPACSWG